MADTTKEDMKDSYFKNMTERPSEAEIDAMFAGSGKMGDQNEPFGDGSYEDFAKLHKHGRDLMNNFPSYNKVKSAGV